MMILVVDALTGAPACLPCGIRTETSAKPVPRSRETSCELCLCLCASTGYLK